VKEGRPMRFVMETALPVGASGVRLAAIIAAMRQEFPRR
jgi:hypothetical protein